MSTVNDELLAMKRIANTLQALDLRAQERTVGWIIDVFGQSQEEHPEPPEVAVQEPESFGLEQKAKPSKTKA